MCPLPLCCSNDSQKSEWQIVEKNTKDTNRDTDNTEET